MFEDRSVDDMVVGDDLLFKWDNEDCSRGKKRLGGIWSEVRDSTVEVGLHSNFYLGEFHTWARL